MKKILLLYGAVLALGACAVESEPKIKFDPTVESLQQYECPEWFRDAKFGIWSCWNAYTVPGQGDWYARNMYVEGSKAYNYHCKTYGHPSEVGYKDVVDLWKGENFNPKEQIELFKKAGAKYFIAMANHHDNFDLWDSKHQPWNSVNYGPKRDIIKEWHEATLESGLRWGVTSHLERTWSWFQVAKLSDKTGKYAGIPYDGANPKYEQIYLPADKNGDTSRSQPINAPEWWRTYWYNRCADLIDNYKPDLFYVDGGVPFPGDDAGKTGLKMMAHLYNQNASWHDGKNEAVMCLKNWLRVAPKGEWGHYWDGIGTLDFEKGRASQILEEPWQTETYLGAWTWTPNIKYRNAGQLIHELVDVVSKNGNLLLNVSPRPDGTLDKECTAILEDIGAWMTVNGESIYETRPWLIYGTGHTRIVKKGEDLYVTTLKYPTAKSFLVPFLSATNSKARVKKVTLLANGEKLRFTESAEGLSITMPEKSVGELAWVFKIEGDDLCSYDVERYKGEAQRDVKQEIQIWREASHSDEIPAGYKAIAYDRMAGKWAISADDVVVKMIDNKPVKQAFKAKDIDFTVTGHCGYISMKGQLYVGKEGKDWKCIAGVEKALRISIAESGTVWVACEDGNLYEIGADGQKKQYKPARNVIDVACGEGESIAYVDAEGVIRFRNKIRKAFHQTGVEVTRIDYSPKTNHLIAVYKGEVAFLKDEIWVFTGVKASNVAGGKSNDDEIIGWIKE